jgi:hypothetical protein
MYCCWLFCHVNWFYLEIWSCGSTVIMFEQSDCVVHVFVVVLDSYRFSMIIFCNLTSFAGQEQGSSSSVLSLVFLPYLDRGSCTFTARVWRQDQWPRLLHTTIGMLFPYQHYFSLLLWCMINRWLRIHVDKLSSLLILILLKLIVFMV